MLLCPGLCYSGGADLPGPRVAVSSVHGRCVSGPARLRGHHSGQRGNTSPGLRGQGALLGTLPSAMNLCVLSTQCLKWKFLELVATSESLLGADGI